MADSAKAVEIDYNHGGSADTYINPGFNFDAYFTNSEPEICALTSCELKSADCSSNLTSTDVYLGTYSEGFPILMKDFVN